MSNNAGCAKCAGVFSTQGMMIVDGLAYCSRCNPLIENTKPETKSTGVVRNFSTGATRDTNQGKLDFEGFNSPLVDKCYAAYLNKHRIQSDGNLRDSDNWQKLFGDDHFNVCMKSLCRHVVDARLAHRGHTSEQPIVDSLCGIIFNANAYLLKLMLEEETLQAAVDRETGGK